MQIQKYAVAIRLLPAVLFVVLGVGRFSEAQQTADTGSTTCAAVTLLEGASTVALPSLEQRLLVAGETLGVGSVLQTGSNSKVELTLSDNSVVRVAEGSSIELAVDFGSGENQTRQLQVKLLKGDMWVTLPGQSEDYRSLQILVANALFVGKEAAFRAVLSRDGAAEIKVYSGYVTASGPFVFVKEASRFLLHLAEEEGQQSTEPWRYRIEPYRKLIIQALGKETKPFRFAARTDLSDWVRWNQVRDEEIK